jgi:hypothetical protein
MLAARQQGCVVLPAPHMLLLLLHVGWHMLVHL